MTLHQSIEAFVKPVPDLKLAFIGHNDDDILKIIHNKIRLQDGKIDAFIYDLAPMNLEGLRVKLMADYSKSFRSIAREYEVLVLNDILQAPIKQDILLKNSFQALENSGHLLIITPSVGKIKEQLETFGFVAIQEIETDDTDRALISAKKMHGWSHGL